MRWIVLIVISLFVADIASDWLVKQQEAKDSKAKQRHEEVGYPTSQVEALNRLAADAGVAFKMGQRDCGIDWLCLIQWANEQHSKKGNRK